MSNLNAAGRLTSLSGGPLSAAIEFQRKAELRSEVPTFPEVPHER
jgi:hypothetical protein